jgi:hypothetical protein
MARRAAWVERQARRNELRVRVLVEEMRLGPEEARAAREALEGFVQGKVALFESLDAQGVRRADPRLTGGLAELRAELERNMTAAIGVEGYRALAAMDAAGRFVLPEEKKKP